MMRLQLLPIIMFLILTSVHAQEVNNEPEDESLSAEQEPTNPVVTSTTQEPTESFLPSEIISEDLSVPFPVDI